MTTVYLGLGSNIERERYLLAGLDALQLLLGELALSPVYDSPAIGFDGQPFLNMVVGARTELPLAALATRLRHIETEHGRPANATRFSARQLDIDILTYGDLVGEFGGVTLPRGEILENAFVLRPLAELAPRAQHPVDGRSFAELWAAFDQRSQVLARVDFSWRGRWISRAV
ncbi:2-amino-4-hydroxy-6-hydroxymethyldihydropteridine diphosphokinase [Haliea sp.]